MYRIENNKIIISDNSSFNAKHILECGQVFRYKKADFGYEVYSLNHKATINCQKDSTIIYCDDVNYFINYFDLNTNYAKIKVALSKDEILNKAIAYGSGIRILRQNPLETIINFIISSNNNIPRIKKIIEDICYSYGDKVNNYYAFPTLEQLSNIPFEFFVKIKSGYRAKYLFETIQKIKSGFDINSINNLTVSEANKYLQNLSGVGEKVADCILLYAFHKTDVFPTDTWIKKVYFDYYKPAKQNKYIGIAKKNNTFKPENKNESAREIRNYFIDKFGIYSGYAQQYLFYYKREFK